MRKLSKCFLRAVFPVAFNIGDDAVDKLNSTAISLVLNANSVYQGAGLRKKEECGGPFQTEQSREQKPAEDICFHAMVLKLSCPPTGRFKAVGVGAGSLCMNLGP